MTRLISFAFVAFFLVIAVLSANIYDGSASGVTTAQDNEPIVPVLEEPFIEEGVATSARPRVAQAIAPSAYCLLPAEARMLSLVNSLRTQSGLQPLYASKVLGAAARDKSISMATYNYFAHDTPANSGELSGRTASQNIVAHGYPENSWKGENIAAGNSTADKTYEQWVNSAPHLENMTRPQFVAIGIGYGFSDAARYKHYWTQAFGGSNLGQGDIAQPCSSTTPTPVPPTATATPRPQPTATVVPPTATPRPVTPVPPTPTRVPPTATPVPPTAVPTEPTAVPTEEVPTEMIVKLNCDLIIVNNEVYDLRCSVVQ
jgi:uncharacterized protein YkwD